MLDWTFFTALKIICRFFLSTSETEFIFKLIIGMTIVCYVDADFAGLWNRKDHDDENCVKIRTGCVLCIRKCPVLWITCLQDGIKLSTMVLMAMIYLMPPRD